MKLISIFLVVLMSGPMAALAQNTVVVVPMDDDLMPITLPQEVVEPEPSPYLDDAIGKPIVWNKGWDTNIGNRTEIDPTVKIKLIDLRPVFGFPGIIYTANEIKKWGLQRYYNTSSRIYAKGVILVDKGDRVEGGIFEWSKNNQGLMSFANILKTGSSTGWVQRWTDPRRGDKVWFFIMSDDEKYSSNPITFIWP